MHALETEIIGATVFRDGARITRTGKITLNPGPQKIVVSKITNYAETDSFRVKGKGNASIASLDSSLKEIVFKPSEKLKPLYDDLHKLEEEKKRIADEIEIYETRVDHLEVTMRRFSETFGLVFAAGEGNISQLTDMDKSSEKLYLDTKKTLRKLSDEAREVAVKLQVLRKNIGEIEAERKVERYVEVEINLEVQKQGEVEIELMYQCRYASWAPSYDLDLYPEAATLRRVAIVRNRTGEDWRKVELVVSTATAKPVEAVEATPFYITVYDPELERRGRRDRKKKRSMAKGRGPPPAPSAAPGMLATIGAPAEPEPVIEETFAEASEGESGIAVYELPKPMTIPSDKEDHPVTLVEEKLSSKTVHYWFADAMAEVVAQDEVTNGENVILRGKVKVFSEGDYIGETSVAQISPREKFKIGTRTAYDVKAKKKMIERDIAKAGVTRGKLRRQYRYELKIESFSKRSIVIEVRDRIPHSLNPSIEVSPIDFDKLGLEEDMKLGILQWKFNIPIGEKKTIEYGYEVVWERSVQISPPLP